jgi:hypothetical protein
MNEQKGGRDGAYDELMMKMVHERASRFRANKMWTYSPRGYSLQPQVVKLRFIAQYLTLNSLFHSVSLFKTFRNCTERSELDDERSNKAVTLSMELVSFFFCFFFLWLIQLPNAVNKQISQRFFKSKKLDQ